MFPAHINHPRPEQITSARRGPSERAMRVFFAAMGLTPTFRAGHSGQPLSAAAGELREAQIAPDYEADGEFLERELFVPEDRGAN